MMRRLPRSTLCPYTTLFRSVEALVQSARLVGEDLDPLGAIGGERDAGAHRLEERAGPDLVEDQRAQQVAHALPGRDRKSTRLNSSHANIPYAVFCLNKK